jgi:hypothetical protein
MYCGERLGGFAEPAVEILALQNRHVFPMYELDISTMSIGEPVDVLPH